MKLLNKYIKEKKKKRKEKKERWDHRNSETKTSC